MRPAYLLILTFTMALTGCTQLFLAHTLVEPPNHGDELADMSDSSRGWMDVIGVDRHLRVEVGPPAASLAMWIVEPRNMTGKKVPHSRGTVLILHGLNDGAFWMLCKAQELSRHGYRTVVVSLRGYGNSTGEYRTFGVVEKCDLSQVIDALQREKLCDDGVGVWGMSYGASTALELAGYDSRVKAVVAVAGFSSMREVVPGTAKLLLPVATWLSSDAQWDQIMDDAAAQAGFDPDAADAKKAIAKTDAAVLIMHGTWDMVVPYANAKRLIAAAKPDRSKLVPFPMAGHTSIWLDVDGRAADLGTAWFDQWLAQ